MCLCGHPAHHHAGGTRCGTTEVTGPPSPPDASAHLEHPGRNWHRCDCNMFDPLKQPGTGDQVQKPGKKDTTK